MKKKDTVGTFPKYDTAGTVPKYDTAGTVLKYDTAGTVLKYDTVGTVLKYDTVGTVLKYDIQIIQKENSIHIAHIYVLSWLGTGTSIKYSGVILVSEMIQVMQVLSTCE
jgi:hypothetical protein